MADRRVYLFDSDISQYVADIPSITPSTGDYGQVTRNDLDSLTGQNTQGFWDTANPASPFYGAADDAGFMIQIEQAGTITWTGAIQSIVSDAKSRTAAVGLRSVLQDALEDGAIYASAAQVTPATAARELLELYRIPIDATSFANANAIYTTDGVYVHVKQLDPDSSLLDLLQRIAEIGVARIYSVNGVVFFDVFETPGTESLVTFTDSSLSGVTLWSPPRVESAQKDRVTGYNVQWAGNPAATFGLESQQPRTIQGTLNDTVQITTLQAAVWIGERWYRYLRTPQQRVSFVAPIGYARSLALGYAISVEYTSGGWAAPLIMDITQIDFGNSLYATITGLTR